jgi:phytoene dehydrogenase-like protein
VGILEDVKKIGRMGYWRGYRTVDGKTLCENNYGLNEGHLYHAELALDQIFFMRPLPGWSRYRTPINNLYLCGSGTHRGGGLNGLPGYYAAREILKKSS